MSHDGERSFVNATTWRREEEENVARQHNAIVFYLIAGREGMDG